MPQFTVHRNQNRETVANYPLLLDVQSDLLAGLATRVIVPLCPTGAMNGKLIKGLTAVFQIEGKEYAMLTPQLAAIPKKHLGPTIGDVARHRDHIIAALDLLITGI